MAYRSKHFMLRGLSLTLVTVLGSTVILAQDEGLPPAEIINDEGGAIAIIGEMIYTDPLFTAGVAQPIVILEDQAGFVDRDKGFLMPVSSQTLGQFTSDFFVSPVEYSIALPVVPRGTYRDVDNNESEDEGVQIYAVAYWTNTFGDGYLEERDLYGGGWSTAYASTRVSNDFSDEGEIIGGKFLIYAATEGQGFPSGFGEDGLLFTDDDPVVAVPSGWTLVDMDSDPFVFDRSANPVIDLVEPDVTALIDYSSQGYAEAFDSMVELFRTEYAFTELKEMDWDALHEEFRPRFEAAEADNDAIAYELALRDFIWEIPDAHTAYYPASLEVNNEFFTNTDGGLGMAIQDVEGGETIVYYLTPGGAAEAEGIELGAQILEVNGVALDDAVSEVVPYSSPFSSDINRRLQQLRYIFRAPLGTSFEITYQNPNDSEPTTVTLDVTAERNSFAVSSFSQGVTGVELPVEFEFLPSGFMYAKITSFFDNSLLTIQLWERLMETLNNNAIPGLIIDMRQNGGGSGFLADQMAAYFFDEQLTIGYSAIYDAAIDDFYIDEERPDVFYPPQEAMQYHGLVAVLVGPNCASACEFFAHDMTVEDRALIVGQYPTGGMGGGIKDFLMPEGFFVRFAIARPLDTEGNIIIEGPGVVPNVQVPVTLESLVSGQDVVLAAAEQALAEAAGVAISSDIVITEGGDVVLGDTLTGEVTVGERVQYTFVPEADGAILIAVDGDLDTYLRIYDADESLIAENDDVQLGVIINSEISSLDVVSGDSYIIEVGTYADSDSGEYTLTLAEAG